jgi:ATP-dependent Clp protease adapter protein ClpS
MNPMEKVFRCKENIAQVLYSTIHVTGNALALGCDYESRKKFEDQQFQKLIAFALVDHAYKLYLDDA